MKVTAGRRQDQQAVPVDELWEYPDRIVETRLAAHLGRREVVDCVDLARVAHAERHAEIAQLRVLAAWHEVTQRLDRVHGLAPAFDLAARQIVGIGAVAAGEVHEIEVRQIALVADGAPRTRQRGE